MLLDTEVMWLHKLPLQRENILTKKEHHTLAEFVLGPGQKGSAAHSFFSFGGGYYIFGNHFRLV